MTQKEFKTFNLLYSFTAKDIQEATEKISKDVYYNSKVNFTMFEQSRGVNYFYFVNYKGEINRNVILANKENSNRYQLRNK
jgi:hypothetical protein